ncbi:DNA repair protein RAD5A isoform X1 [Physcomitrium patens]|uniref:SNF2 family DNA-dependent ATPase n=2 Tax=Physcomitrium patens TaxID=3218 RepID=A0A2K1KII9_PHYPA|nr:DNA repair protein RAD5A-like [Physcomitrium patens]PNR53589.1 hypothetical protein PHYPA_007264 [Physcomitrium patens]|eukprot:XP_024376643.1 DNA repair protein RAD5A-like [Physcomitrella patens]
MPLGVGDPLGLGRSGNLGRRREMAKQVSKQSIAEMRAIVGVDPSEMDLIRALHLAGNDVAAAVNIYFDTPKSNFASKPKIPRRPVRAVSSSTQVRPSYQRSNSSSSSLSQPSNHSSIPKAPAERYSNSANMTNISDARPSPELASPRAHAAPDRPPPVDYPSHADSEHTRIELKSRNADSNVHRMQGISPGSCSAGSSEAVFIDQLAPAVETLSPGVSSPNPAEDNCTQQFGPALMPSFDLFPSDPDMSTVSTIPVVPSLGDKPHNSFPNDPDLSVLSVVPGAPKRSVRMFPSCAGESLSTVVRSASDKNWLLLGEAEVVGYSTCKGPKLQAGDLLQFNFPKPAVAADVRKGPWGRGKGASTAAEIVRFSCQRSGEVGRIPGDWARSLIPLVNSGKVKVEGKCRSSPANLSLMSSIIVDFKVYVCRSMFAKYNSSTARITASSEGTLHQPLPTLLRLLHRQPITRAAFTPEELYSRKRTLDRHVGDVTPIVKKLKLSSAEGSTAGAQAEVAEEEVSVLSDEDVTKLVGSADACKLDEMDPPPILNCELRPYQKQALHWMTQLEIGATTEDASRTLHPCWEAYDLSEENTTFYLNLFSGEASLEFPSASSAARGGILADAMGLGKTVMMISVVMANPGRGGLATDPAVSGSSNTLEAPRSQLGNLSQVMEMRKKQSGLRKGGGTLIVCPMTLLGQWKSEFETHVAGDSLSVYAYYGTDRIRERKALLEHDIVLTTYGVVASESNQSNFMEDGPLHSIHWFRIVLDEAHTIKAFRTSTSKAVFMLTADRRWCLTGTPIQNKLEDVFSLLHFLRIEPWSNYSWWEKLVQKPCEEGDERGLNLLQAILQPLMLRRTKDSLDQHGRPILVLPSVDMQVVECEFTEAEQDFYTALYKKSKTKFDQFVEQGKVLHNYASILELLLRLRQCCDHPFLVMSRGDTADYADLDKLAKRFLKGEQEGLVNRPTKAFVEEVVKDLQTGQKGECPICLESMEDAVLTPCAHRLCRDCLFASWRSYGGGPCPICRQTLTRQDIITAPSESRFQVDVEANWTDSCKVNALMNELEELRPSGAKSVVFSQWTAFLDLLEIPFKRKKIKFVRLDGSLSQQQREKVLNDFRSQSDIMVMLISLKAGGVGINLTTASNAFLLDPWWNPAVEEQAIMRIHRIGQTKDVQVKRFIVKGSVEEKMQAVQARKQRMIAGALNNQEVRVARIEELKMLFC